MGPKQKTQKRPPWTDEKGTPMCSTLPDSDQPIRALVLSSVYPSARQPRHGLFVEERIRHLAELARIRVVSPVAWQKSLGNGFCTQEERQGIQIHHPRFWYLPRFQKEWDGALMARSVRSTVQRLAQEEPIDLIDAHFVWPEGFAALRLGQELGVPVCVTLRGTLEWLAEDPARKDQMAQVVREADQLIAVSEPLAQRALDLGADASRVTVVTNGVDIERFQLRSKEQARKSLGLKTDAQWVVSVGHLSERKGFQDLIGIMGHLLATHPNTNLCIVGGGGAEGDNTEQLKSQAQEAGVAHKVHFLGPRSPEDVARALAAADVFALASRYEGCPNVLLEALASGRPVVASNVGEIPRLVTQAGGLVYGQANDRDALLRGLREVLNTEWDPHGVRASVLQRTWHRTAQEVLEIWSRALHHATAKKAKPAATTTTNTP